MDSNNILLTILVLQWHYCVLCRGRNIEASRLVFPPKSAARLQTPDLISARFYIFLQIVAIGHQDSCETIHAVRSTGIFLYPTSRNGTSHVKALAAKDGQCIHESHRFSLPDRKLALIELSVS